jgi:hypothetical protein
MGRGLLRRHHARQRLQGKLLLRACGAWRLVMLRYARVGSLLSTACVMLRPMEGRFLTYILQCSDGSYYVGQTDDLDRRIGEHEAGGHCALRMGRGRGIPARMFGGSEACRRQ